MIRLSTFMILAMGALAIYGASGHAAPDANANQGRPGAELLAGSTKRFTPQESPRGANPLWGIPIAALNATQERPLFAPTRRPPPTPVIAEESPPPAAPPPPPEPEKPQLTLVGTVTGEPQSVAVVRDEATSSLVHLHVGEEIAGWSLRSVDSRAMTVEKDSQTVTLTLPAPGTATELAPPGLAAVQQAFRVKRQF